MISQETQIPQVQLPILDLTSFVIITIICISIGIAGSILYLRSSKKRKVEPKRKPTKKKQTGKFCIDCGAKIPKDSKFCKTCGKKQ